VVGASLLLPLFVGAVRCCRTYWCRRTSALPAALLTLSAQAPQARLPAHHMLGGMLADGVGFTLLCALRDIAAIHITCRSHHHLFSPYNRRAALSGVCANASSATFTGIIADPHGCAVMVPMVWFACTENWRVITLRLWRSSSSSCSVLFLGSVVVLKRLRYSPTWLVYGLFVRVYPGAPLPEQGRFILHYTAFTHTCHAWWRCRARSVRKVLVPWRRRRHTLFHRANADITLLTWTLRPGRFV